MLSISKCSLSYYHFALRRQPPPSWSHRCLATAAPKKHGSTPCAAWKRQSQSGFVFGVLVLGLGFCGISPTTQVTAGIFLLCLASGLKSPPGFSCSAWPLGCDSEC